MRCEPRGGAVPSPWWGGRAHRRRGRWAGGNIYTWRGSGVGGRGDGGGGGSGGGDGRWGAGAPGSQTLVRVRTYNAKGLGGRDPDWHDITAEPVSALSRAQEIKRKNPTKK